ncbi:MAG TPA: MFS transporter [Candidatus Saccharimonadales bacterium]|nr:MFS transporter [Candidatus Saccharimonadales bacterium]
MLKKVLRHTTKESPHYKWIALSNTTLGVLMATLNATSLIIALPVIFRGINLNPLAPSSFSYLLWILLGYLLVAAILVVSLGRLGDMYGRVKMYNLGFIIFSLGALGAALTWSHGPAGALELILFRVVQSVGGAMLMANSAAILTDAFPHNQRGMALGINQIAALAGSFLGILVGGFLSQFSWRWVFLFNVPIGIIGVIWSYVALKEIDIFHPAKIDWWGNVTFALGLGMVLVGITYGIRPHGSSAMGWGDPLVIGLIIAGLIILALFATIEKKVKQPMFNLELFNIRAFTAGNIAGLMAAMSRGGLQFMLIMWLQGIWLPLHGYAFTDTPLWAGIYMLPTTIGFLIAGPLSGYLSDKYGARPFATGGMLLAAASFGLMMLLPVNFSYWVFALILLLNGMAFGLFSSPNTAGIMNSVPSRFRGVASGMRATFMNVGLPLSIGIFFTLMIVGLTSSVPSSMYHGLTANGVSPSVATNLSHLPAISYLFAAFLGYNPLKTLLGPSVLNHLPAGDAARLTSKEFFPQLIGSPFKHGLVVVLSFSIVACLVAAAASWLRGGKFIHEEAEATS